MEIFILEYSDGTVIRVKLNENQKTLFEKDADTFIEMLSEIYKFRVQDVSWVCTENEIEEHQLSDDVGEHCEQLRICSVCGSLMRDGYCEDMGAAYYCCDDCLHKEFTEEEWREECEENDQSYYTEWESYNYLNR